MDREPRNAFNSSSRPFFNVERDPFKIQVRQLPVGIEEPGLRNLLSNFECPPPTAVWVNTRKIEGSATGEQKTIAFVEFASTRDAEQAFSKLHRKEFEQLQIFCSYAVKRPGSIKERNVEKEFQEFLENYVCPVEPVAKPSIKPVMGTDHRQSSPEQIDTVVPSNSPTDPFQQLVGSVVTFLQDHDSGCTYCKMYPSLSHLHFIVSDSSIIDPSEMPPMVEVSCATCSKETGLKKCSSCSLVYYCSRDCQIQDWPKHSDLCTATRSPLPGSYSNSASNTPTHVLKSQVNEKEKRSIEIGGGDVVDGLKMETRFDSVPNSLKEASNFQNADVVKLELNKLYNVMVVWKHENENNLFSIAPSEQVMYSTIMPNTVDAGSLSNVVVSVGCYCIAKSVDDNEYYRAKVVEVYGDCCKVYFIDYGNTNIVPVDGLKPLVSPITIEETPGQAIQVIPDDASKMEEYFELGEILPLIPVSINANGVYEVKVKA